MDQQQIGSIIINYGWCVSVRFFPFLCLSAMPLSAVFRSGMARAVMRATLAASRCGWLARSARKSGDFLLRSAFS